jgi:hypothetical protein
MGILRVPVRLIFAGFLAGCAPHIPLLETQDDVATAKAQPDRTVIESESWKRKLPPPESAAASTTPHDTKNSTIPNVGSPQKWEKERAEDERKEQHLKQVIEGICRGC